MVKNYTEILYENQTLTTDRLILRKFKAEDAQAVLEYGSDEETVRYLVWDGVKTIEDAKVSIYEYYWSKPGIYAIELKESGKCIGGIEIRLVPEHEKADFGYVLNKNYWGQGIMSEALAAILELGFEKLKLNKVDSCHYVGNEGSGKVMQKCGLQYEGVIKSEFKIKDIFRDCVHYGITQDMYRQMCEAKNES